ncbi:MAG: ABC transporter substrate-binding protein [Caldilinea sp.]
MTHTELSRRTFLKAASALVGVSIVAACAPPAAPGAQPAAGVETVASSTELSFWTFVDQHVSYYESRVARWNEQNPDRQITLAPSNQPYQEMHDKLLISLQSGTGAPDIVDIEIAKWGPFLRGDVQLYELTDVMLKYQDQIMPQRAYLYSREGKIYGAPTHLGVGLMYYNDELMQQAGVNVDEINAWDSFIAAGKQFKEALPDIAFNVQESTDMHTYSLLAHMNGGSLMTEEGQPNLYTPENVEALQFCQDLILQHGISQIAPGGFLHAAEAFDAWNKGKIASIFMPQWYMIRFPDNMPDLQGKIKVRNIPLMKADGYSGAMGGGTGTAITKQIGEDKIQLAIDFIEFAKLTKEANVAIYREFGFDPFRYDAYEDPALNETSEFFSGEAPMQQVKNVYKNLAPHYVGDKYPEVAQELRTVVCFEAFEKGSNPDQILKDAQAKIEAM